MKTRIAFKSITFVGIVIGVICQSALAGFNDGTMTPVAAGRPPVATQAIGGAPVAAADVPDKANADWYESIGEWLRWLLPQLQCPKAPPPDDVETAMRQATECYQAHGTPVPQHHLHRTELILGLGTIELLVEIAPAEIDPTIAGEFLEAIRKMKNELEAGQ